MPSDSYGCGIPAATLGPWRNPSYPAIRRQRPAAGRVALWLDPDDLRRLAEHCCCPEDAPAEVTERCLRLRFRARAALHKGGLIG
ncbi:hypothetical protein [Streptomyces bobili]|uniref:hypothetical protein n=1 Tax=Streptomyces bobili TaxID=67280 RepID=UPI0037AD81BB